MQLPASMEVAPVKGRQSEGRSKARPAEHEYDVLLLTALHHLALRSHSDDPVLLSRERHERFGPRTRRSMALLAIGGSLSK